MRPLRVFLCHSVKDKLAVRELSARLKAEAWIDPWLDEDKLLPGQDWHEEIEKAVEKTDVVIVFLSNKSVTQEGYVQRELKLALDVADEKIENTIFIIPLRLEECPAPRRLRGWQYLDYFPKGIQPLAYNRLLKSLQLRAENLGVLHDTPIVTPPIPKPKTKLNFRLIGIGLVVLISIILGGFGLNFLFDQSSVATITPTSPSSTDAPIFFILTNASITPTRIPSQTPSPILTLDIGSTMISETDGMVMVYVPEGEFTMGEGSAEHQVYLDAYWVDFTEVTNAMFVDFLNKNGNKAEGGSPWLAASDPDARIFLDSNEWVVQDGYDDHPVTEVTWFGARSYCSWAGRELPTEAQWEKTARGTDGRTYPWGESIDCSFANYWGQNNGCIGDTTEVGSYPSGSSVYGALDMAGNIWEWVSSLYQDYPYDENDGREDLTTSGSRVLRGGSWYLFDSGVRSADRGGNDPTLTSYDIGFRCALSQP